MGVFFVGLFVRPRTFVEAPSNKTVADLHRGASCPRYARARFRILSGRPKTPRVEPVGSTRGVLPERSDDELRRRTRSVWRLSLREDSEKTADFSSASGSSSELCSAVPPLRPNLTNSNVRNSKRTVSGLVRFSSFRLTYAHELAPPRRLRIREPFHSSFGTYNGSRAPRRSGRAFGYSARKSRRPFYAFYAP